MKQLGAHLFWIRLYTVFGEVIKGLDVIDKNCTLFNATLMIGLARCENEK
jgi:cyclophilin family peptidyl-prolyl cis-trans isomerase